jgi:hypothetical protein
MLQQSSLNSFLYPASHSEVLTAVSEHLSTCSQPLSTRYHAAAVISELFSVSSQPF